MAIRLEYYKTSLIAALAFSLAIVFLAEVLGHLTRPFNTLLGLIFLALFLGRFVSRQMVLDFGKRWPVWLLALGALVGVFYGTGWICILFVSVLLAGIRLLRLNEERDTAALRVAQNTAFAYGVFLWFWRETATGWYALDRAASGFTWVAQHLGLNVILGATASGLPLTILLFIYGVACILAKPRNRLRTILALTASLLVVQIAFFAIHDTASAARSVSLAMHRGAGASATWYPFAFIRYLYPNNLQWIPFLLGLAATVALTPAPLSVNGPGRSVALRRRTMVLGAVAVFAGTALYGFVPPRSAGGGEILIHDAGYLNWKMPVFGSYGDKSGGMFGRLPQFLGASGYSVKQRPASKESLRSAKVLVVINLMEKFDRPTKVAIWDFVRRGGGLVVLGDHTGVQGIREPFNDLLEPVNITFNFDSAKAFRDGWLWAYGLPRHATTAGIDDAINEIEIWIGASLTAAPPARPLIVGSQGFSDPGNMQNQQRGYLGNLRYDPGERLSDILLAAECRYGKGKVLVFGDTSPFQNGALVYSHRFVENVFAWLGDPQDSSAYSAKNWAAAVLILVGLGVLAGRARTSHWPAIAAIAFLMGWTLGIVPAKAFNVPSTAHNNIAWIDISHLERVSLNSWVDDGFGGLAYNLMRNGYSPLLMTRWDTRALERGALLILIGPSKPFSATEVKAVREFIHDGGHLILAAGWEDLSGSEELWEEFGLRVKQMPLGRVLVKQPEGDIRLYKGWSIEASQGKPEILCSPWGYPAIVRLPVGKGSVVAIADTQFLLNRNLEGTERYYAENIAFLRRLLEKLKKNETGISLERKPTSDAYRLDDSLEQEGSQ